MGVNLVPKPRKQKITPGQAAPGRNACPTEPEAERQRNAGRGNLRD